MKSYFSIIYLKPNRFSEEKISIGLIGCNTTIPFFILNEKKLSFGLKTIDKELRYFIRKSLKLLSFDINRYREGKETLPLFDEVVSLKYLKGLKKNKQGIIHYGEPIEFQDQINLEKIATKIYRR